MERTRLVIGRKLLESVDIGDATVTVTMIKENQVKLLIEAPKKTFILRQELKYKINQTKT